MNYQSLTDNRLVELLKSSDQKAFRALYERYWKQLFFIAYHKLRSKELAEEVVQNIFTGIWEKRTTSDIREPEHYLKTALRYQVISTIQAQLAKEKMLHSPSFQPELEEDAFSSINLMDLQTAMQQAIAMLPDKTGEIFRLSRLEHYPVKQIALRLNISEKAVEYHITRSLKLMRIQLREFMVLLLSFLISMF
ncbi:MAG: sigma-70 family RNA polymerase sigma factor [Chitinophagaceae bacterium]